MDMRASQVVLEVKNLPTNAEDIRDPGSIPGSERSPGWGCGNPLQYSCLENPVDRRAWRATIPRVTQSHTRLKQLSTHTHMDLNLNKLQETVEDRGAWSATVHGITKSWTQQVTWTTATAMGESSSDEQRTTKRLLLSGPYKLPN